jgi:formylglycine-generating enzyme
MKTYKPNSIKITTDFGQEQNIKDTATDLAREIISQNLKLPIHCNALLQDLLTKCGVDLFSKTPTSNNNFVKVKGNDEIKTFDICKYQVTQREFESVMGFNPSNFNGDSLPVEQVTWYDTLVYCNKLSKKEGLSEYYNLSEVEKNSDGNITKANVRIIGGNGYRLPTNDEWEYAAKGGNESKGYIYSGGNDIEEVAWHWDNSGRKTQPVGTKQANELGIYDMSGNVWEWTETEKYLSACFCRGGSWLSNSLGCKVIPRSYDNLDGRSYNLGFRVCRG